MASDLIDKSARNKADVECLTWNVHRCRGQDGIIDPIRTENVILELVKDGEPDLLVLTEADAEQPPYGALLDLDEIVEKTSMRHAQAEGTLRWGKQSSGFLGTVVLYADRFELVHGALLDLPGHYPRGATILTFRHQALLFSVIATHLSLTQALRIVQMRTIGQYLNRQPSMPAILIGDLNEWRPWNGLAFSERVVGHEFRGPSSQSFPSHRPFLPLDRVMATAPARVSNTRAIFSERVRKTSDHLPVRATVSLL
ncbi:endonuclease/exonuclease/phosphatase family protein [Yoonia sp.]|uniref:endonuclease/exonuclease/phosphatase family protein n=1 Tax=Yoonia sp. TaxID=2212373 RepID=UPI002E0C97DA|nr:endonuclease/exonuclease/phosphatase family protein [Yoonia sp.]